MSNPWESCGWTKARYFSFIRSALRRATMKYPASRQFLDEQCRPAPAGMRAKKVCDCAICGVTIPKSHAEVDHKIPAGTIKDFSDVEEFVKRLFCSKDGYQILCSRCHKIKSYADKYGMTFEEAAKTKETIEFLRWDVHKQKEYLLGLGFAESDISNAEKRKKCYRSTLDE